MKLWQKNLILIALVALIAVVPLIFVDGEYGGADGEAEEAITQIDPDYEPWFSPLFEPKSGEIESLLFALQAALGAGVIGFALGRITSRKKNDSDSSENNVSQ